MALDSASRGPLLLGYPERLWPPQTELLGPAYPPVVRNDRCVGAREWPRSHNLQPSPEGKSESMRWKIHEPNHQRPTPKGIPELEPLLPWQRPAYPQQERKLDDVIMTSPPDALSRQPFQNWPSEQQSNDVIITAEMRPRTSSWQRYVYESKNNPPADVSLSPYQRFAYESRSNPRDVNPRDVNMTSSSVATTGHPPPWQQHEVHLAKDHSSSDVMMTSYRERSQSTGSWRSFVANRGHSGSSLVSWNVSEDLSPTSRAGQRSEALSEETYRELVNLWASSRSNKNRWDVDRIPRFTEVPRSPFEEACRRYSEASQRQHLKGKLEQARQRYDDLPIDMTCRKRKTRGPGAGGLEPVVSAPASLGAFGSEMKTVSPGMSSRGSGSALSSDVDSGISLLRPPSPEMSLETSCPKSPSVIDVGGGDHRSETDFEEGSYDQTSILRSMLTERGRSNSMSVLELRRRRLEANRVGSAWPGDDAGRRATERTRLATISNTTTTPSSNDKQIVTLAKKNLLPVTARITDLLGRIADFARSLPEFLRLSLTDQEAVLTGACLRLLVLYMAETNLQFATTVLSADRSTSPTECPPGSGGETRLAAARGTDQRPRDQRPRNPNVQFVGCLQNFVRKCQTLNVTGEEYFHMKLITLFHSGVGSPDCVRSSVRINSVARQDLQECVLRSHPNERLRYSTLLLSLHTLFGIHCDMMRTLFCQHLNKTGGIPAFITEALAAELAYKKEAK